MKILKLPRKSFLLSYLMNFAILLPLTAWIKVVFGDGVGSLYSWPWVVGSTAVCSLMVVSRRLPWPNVLDDVLQERARKARQKQSAGGEPERPISDYNIMGVICGVVGIVSSLAHLISGRPTTLQVALFTAAAPGYAWLVARLLTALTQSEGPVSGAVTPQSIIAADLPQSESIPAALSTLPSSAQVPETQRLSGR